MSGSGERKQGLATVLAELPPAARPDGQDASQPDLLSAEDLPEDVGAGPLDSALADLGAALKGTPRRGRGGRPAGSGNRSTEAWRRYFLSQRRDPAFVLADVYSMPVEELAGRLGCDKLDAIKIQMAAAKELMPYVHQRMPQAVQWQGDNLPTLVLHMGVPGGGEPGSGGFSDGSAVLDLTVAEIVEDQILSGSGRETSNGTSSNEIIENGGIAEETAGLPTDLGSVQ